MALTVALTGCRALHTAPPSDGAPSLTGIGDGYFELDGSAGIDVERYRIRNAYDFDSGVLSGDTTLTITATQQLPAFSLDFLLPVSGVELSTGDATFVVEQGHELVITPERPIGAGERFRVTVGYSGTPVDHTYLGQSNWHADGHEVVTVDEPHMAPWWFPANDHPADKALMDISITVPQGNTVVSNGRLVSRRTNDDGVTFRWRADEPMATYLAFFAAGGFDTTSGVADGVPWFNAVSRQGSADERRISRQMLAKTPELVGWLSSRLGDYPFEQTGGVVTSLDVGFSLETQTRPVYGSHLTQDSTYLMVHELAHQWFGDSVSVRRWRDIWLNEGFATFMSWAYVEEHGGPSARRQLDSWLEDNPASSDLWDISIAAPPPLDLFHFAVYQRGAMALQTLRQRIGDDDFWAILRRWVADRRYGHGTTEQFADLAERVSGEDLDDFFKTWVERAVRP